MRLAVEFSGRTLLSERKLPNKDENKVYKIGNCDHTLAIERNGDHEELYLHFRQPTISRAAQTVILFSLTEQAFDLPLSFHESLSKGRR